MAAGVHVCNFQINEDMAFWRARQAELVAAGADLAVDGIPGPATIAALKAAGYRNGIYGAGKVPELP